MITGLGVVAPTGIGKEAFWSASIAGRSGIRHITRFDASQLATRIAGEVPDFDPAPLGLTPDEICILDRGTQFALAAAHLAIEDSGLLPALQETQRERMGVFMGAAMSPGDEGEKCGYASPVKALIHPAWTPTHMMAFNRPPPCCQASPRPT